MEADLELLNNARMMNKDALIKIFDLYSSSLFKYARRLCGNAILADQIVGDVFAKLLDQFSVGNGPQSNLRSYLYEMVHHLIIDEARHSQRRVSLESAEWLEDDVDTAVLGLEDPIMHKHILHAIQNKLTNDQRHVIILRILEGFSLHETAAIMGKRVDHVKVIQGRAIAVLRRYLEHQGMKKVAASPKVENSYNPVGV